MRRSSILLTLLWVISGLVGSLFSRRFTLAVVRSWADLNHWLVEHLLRIRVRVEGAIPQGQYLFAVKHQSMLETLEMVPLAHLPVIVIKRELGRHPTLRLDDAVLWRHSGGALRGSQGATPAGRGREARDWRRAAR